MGIFELRASTSHGAARSHLPLLTTFAGAILVSAGLLFLLQPMFTKMVLPRFGGAPSVWSVAMVFFQAALLAGYAFAHLLTRYTPGSRSVIIQLAVMLAAIFPLPLSIAAGWDRPPPVGEAFWLIGLFTVSIGLPFFALAANSPLLQAWFARTDHPAAKDPYFLYAASNAGSLLALISYPLAVEPFIRLGEQARLWSIGFYALIVIIAACGVLLWRSPDQSPAATAEGAADAAPPNRWVAARWVALAAVPSGLLVAVTAHISTDVAAVPLLWVLPLALYLLTFVIAFMPRPIIPHWRVVAVQPLFVLTGVLAVLIFDLAMSIVWLVAVHVALFFISALMCHGELARTRPTPENLTAFYLWISVGGVVGGIATGLFAPHVFKWVAEYPLLIVLTVLCRPLAPTDRPPRQRPFAALTVAALLLATRVFLPIRFDEFSFWAFGVLLVASVWFWRGWFAVTIAFALVLFILIPRGGAVFERSFFGVAKIIDTPDGRFRVLSHGTTMHGVQRIRTNDGKPVTGSPDLLLYYWDGSAIAQTFDAVRAQVGGPIHYAVIGLGTGSLACRAAAADTVHYYEIDPTIIRIARDPTLFSFLSECRPDAPIIVGDARLTLAGAPDAAYHLIIVDAFSSDAIPLHLLTREAMAIYLKKLKPHGIVVLHITNRHLELASVAAGIAAANGAIALVHKEADLDQTAHRFKLGGTVAAVARSEEDFGRLARAFGWELMAPDPNQPVWTDDYSNVVGSVLRKLKERS